LTNHVSGSPKTHAKNSVVTMANAAASLNDALIRQFQEALALTRTQSSFNQFAFYIGHFCAVLPAGFRGGCYRSRHGIRRKTVDRQHRQCAN
jgi:fucose permease